MAHVVRNLFAGLANDLPEEQTDVVVHGERWRVERIVSTGQASPPGFWYDQNEFEWVVVLRGEARLLFEGDAQPIALRAGDSISIPARRRHRVEWTAPGEPTVWLALFATP